MTDPGAQKKPSVKQQVLDRMNEDPGLSSIAYRVGGQLLHRLGNRPGAKNYGLAWPSIPFLSQVCGLGQTAVKTALRRLTTGRAPYFERLTAEQKQEAGIRSRATVYRALVLPPGDGSPVQGRQPTRSPTRPGGGTRHGRQGDRVEGSGKRDTVAYATDNTVAYATEYPVAYATANSEREPIKGTHEGGGGGRGGRTKQPRTRKRAAADRPDTESRTTTARPKTETGKPKAGPLTDEHRRVTLDLCKAWTAAGYEDTSSEPRQKQVRNAMARCRKLGIEPADVARYVIDRALVAVQSGDRPKALFFALKDWVLSDEGEAMRQGVGLSGRPSSRQAGVFAWLAAQDDVEPDDWRAGSPDGDTTTGEGRR